MAEDRETRLKRLRIRSWRRGTKEMDLVLGGFADARLAQLTDAELNAHEQMMAEHDQDLYIWVSGQEEPPKELRDAIKLVQAHFLENKPT